MKRWEIVTRNSGTFETDTDEILISCHQEMDTTHREMIAVDRVASALQEAGLLVAKPKLDKDGTDLLAFLEMGDGVKFCRIQSKYRSLLKSDSYLSVPVAYVTNGFVLIAYVDGGRDGQNLYGFVASDIVQWARTKNDEYRLPLKRATYLADLRFYVLDRARIGLIESIIRSAAVTGQFKVLMYGRADISMPVFTVAAEASLVSRGKSD